MIIDTHTHALMSKEAAPNYNDIKFNLEVAKKVHSINLICFTEHLDALHYKEMMTNIFHKNIFNGEQLSSSLIKLNDNFSISSGAEISLKGGADVGVHAPLEVLFSLNAEKGYYSIDTLYQELNKSSDFLIFAHHLFKPGKWIEGFEEHTDLLDAIELPAKDIGNKEKYYSLAKSYNKKLIAGSDAHTWVQIGVGRTCLNDDCIELNSEFYTSVKTHIRTDTPQLLIEPNATKIVEMSIMYRKNLIN